MHDMILYIEYQLHCTLNVAMRFSLSPCHAHHHPFIDCIRLPEHRIEHINLSMGFHKPPCMVTYGLLIKFFSLSIFITGWWCCCCCSSEDDDDEVAADGVGHENSNHSKRYSREFLEKRHIDDEFVEIFHKIHMNIVHSVCLSHPKPFHFIHIQPKISMKSWRKCLTSPVYQITLREVHILSVCWVNIESTELCSWCVKFSHWISWWSSISNDPFSWLTADHSDVYESDSMEMTFSHLSRVWGRWRRRLN